MKEIFRCLITLSLRKIMPFFVIFAVVITSCQSLSFNSHVTPAPTPQCIEPTLTLGTSIFHVDTVTREADNFPKIPKNKKDVAFWVEGTTVNYVFALSPTKDNLALDAVLKPGDPVVISWADCSKDEYVLTSVEKAQPNDLTVFDQSSGGITVYVQDKSTALLIRGARPGIQSQETSVPVPADEIQIDLQIVEFTQPDEQTVQFQILVTNSGAQAITLTHNDIALISADGSETSPQKVTPDLPQELKAGDIIPLTLTFPRPQGNSAVLRILNTTFEYYF